MSRDLVARLDRVLVLDGGLATELERRGASLADPLWSARVLIEQPELVRAVHRSYLEAGADVITTATYQATFQGLAARGLDGARAEALLRSSVELARAAWGELEAAADRSRARPLIAASIGPYGAFLADGSEYRGEYGLTDRELIRFHRDRLFVLADAGPDLLALETIPSRREAEALVELLEQQGGAVAWISLTGRDEAHIADGTSFAECVASLQQSDRVIAVGINCTAPAVARELLARAAPVARKPFVVYPNTGEAWDAVARSWRGAGTAAWIDRDVPRYLDLGARLVGGCCRTTPADTTRLRALVDARADPADASGGRA